MSAPATAVASSPPQSERGRLSFWDTRRGAVVVGTVLALALSWSMIKTIWLTGPFVDTDDAMRMVQVRDWLAGQGWYDLTAYRIDPPFGVFMHWSRIVDVPLAALLKGFGLFAPPAQAERLARLVYSLAWQPALIFAACWSAQALEGRRALTPVAILTALSGLTFSILQPGRIEHDSMQLTLFALAFGAMLRALDPEAWIWAAWSGGFAALGLAVGLEELPLFLILFAALPLAWVLRGEPLRRALVAFAAALLVALTALFFATVGPGRRLLVVCDALSLFHLVALGLGALACLAFAAASPRLPGRGARLAVALAAGALIVAVARLSFPVCFASPFAQVDPLVRRLWLDRVSEARPLLSVIAARPALAPMLVAPLLFALAAALEGAVSGRGLARERWVLTLALLAVGGALAFWEVRGLVCVAPIVLVAAARAAAFARRAAARASVPVRAAAVVLALAPFSSLPYAVIPAFADNRAAAQFMAMGFACLQPQSFAPIAALPPGLTLAPINAGSHLLVYTRDSVLGAPYHRDNRGNRFVIEAFRAAPEAAKTMVEAQGVRYVMACRGLDAAVAPGSLAAALEAGRPPSWLAQLALAGTPFKVFVVKSAP